MKAAVLIPCHSRPDLLRQALGALSSQQVLVVDDSVDGLGDLGVPTIRTGGAQGFSSAINLGLSHLEAEGVSHVLLLNDDAVPRPGCVASLLEGWTEADGAIGPTLICPQGMASSGFIVRDWGRVRVRPGKVEQPTQVDAISGAAMLIRVTERLDEGYRHGFEDLDLCRRLRNRGLRIRTLPVVCTHVGGATVPQHSRLAQRSALAGHLRYLGGGWRSGLAVALSVGQVLREGGSPVRMLGVIDGWRDYRRGHCAGSAS